MSLAFAICICYKYSNELLYLSVRPLLYLDKSFIFTELTEAFYVTLKVCALWSFGFTLPFLFYQSWCFVAPSWFSLERTRWGGVLLLCGCFSALAIAVTYTVLLPKVASVLLTFEVVDPVLSIQLEARIGPYIDLTLKATLLAIILLQLPIFFCICFYLEVFKPSLLTSNRKFLLVSSLLMAAVVSPWCGSSMCIDPGIKFMVGRCCLVWVCCSSAKRDTLNSFFSCCLQVFLEFVSWVTGYTNPHIALTRIYRLLVSFKCCLQRSLAD